MPQPKIISKNKERNTNIRNKKYGGLIGSEWTKEEKKRMNKAIDEDKAWCEERKKQGKSCF